MEIVMIAAMSDNNIIGNKGQIPWRISEDFKRFKELTMGYPVIMGRKTYESLPSNVKPLPGRTNIIMSKSFTQDFGIKVFGDFGKAIVFAKDEAKRLGKERIFVIGGAEIYRMFMPVANKLEITQVNGLFEGDVSFPDIDKDVWKEIYRDNRVEENGLKYSFVTYSRQQ
jgi:dihydrofolate reductase